ncbi:Protein FAM214A [Acropora cervicornis]|uniref:Protein FAM214A n=1 Tax=Acropora cervicornis TaxID=6130 RepID=A0AAD9QQB0_ACRCE|nr:Protein FAM214A [Acropora cervicornis]
MKPCGEGMLIVEGRTPEYSDKGRIQGPHCMSWFSMDPHVCDQRKDYRCQKAVERREQMAGFWQNGSPMVITVLTQSLDDKKWILLERWTVKAIEGISDSVAEDSTCESFLKEPDFHTFPLANLHSKRVLHVSVESLPRCNMFNLTDESHTLKLHHLCQSASGNDQENKDLRDASVRSPLKKKSCISQCDANNDSQTISGQNYLKNHENILENLKPSTTRTCSLVEEIVPRSSGNQNIFNSVKNSANTIQAGLLRSVDVNKEMSGHSSLKTRNKQFCKKDQSAWCISETEQGTHSASKISTPLGVMKSSLHSHHVGSGTLPVFNSRTGLPISSSPVSKKIVFFYGAAEISSNQDLTTILSKSAPASTTQSLLGNFEVPLHYHVDCHIGSQDVVLCLERWEGVGLSKQARWQSLVIIIVQSLSKANSGVSVKWKNGAFGSCGGDNNKEEKKLSYTVGFMAELGASGSFCPAHVTLPVKAYFFSLSDDNAPSPYLGYINLNHSSISIKGYHVPTKGTVQLTLFNPNKTVVKVFVVLYDFSDMPPKAQTFLRQRTFSVCKRTSHSGKGQNCLHYLIHLRFASSKSARLYLHTDIRVIFARQPPDLPTGVTFCTVTDGPTEPKYTL